MTTSENAVLRQLALRALVRQTAPDADAGALAAAARRAYDDLARVLDPLIGTLGVEALAARATHLAQRDYGWLASASGSKPTEGSFDHVCDALEQQAPALAAEAGAAVLASFIGLLATLIGERLTTQLMRQAWTDRFSGAGTEETRE
jgi:hypothetical protein